MPDNLQRTYVQGKSEALRKWERGGRETSQKECLQKGMLIRKGKFIPKGTLIRQEALLSKRSTYAKWELIQKGGTF